MIIKLRIKTVKNGHTFKYWLEEIKGKMYLCKSRLDGKYMTQTLLAGMLNINVIPKTRPAMIFLRNKVEIALGRK